MASHICPSSNLSFSFFLPLIPVNSPTAPLLEEAAPNAATKYHPLGRATIIHYNSLSSKLLKPLLLTVKNSHQCETAIIKVDL